MKILEVQIPHKRISHEVPDEFVDLIINTAKVWKCNMSDAIWKLPKDIQSQIFSTELTRTPAAEEYGGIWVEETVELTAAQKAFLESDKEFKLC